jgi:hypothetical protein
MSNLILRTYETGEIRLDAQFTDEGFFNATPVAQQFNKRPVDWLRLPDTREYIGQLCDFLTIDENQLVITKTGAQANGGGTWLHAKLAVLFARWLDTRFAIWCDQQIGHILLNSGSPFDRMNQTIWTLEDQVNQQDIELRRLRPLVRHLSAKLARFEKEDASRLPIRTLDYQGLPMHFCNVGQMPALFAHDLAGLLRKSGLSVPDYIGSPRPPIKKHLKVRDDAFIGYRSRQLMDAFDMPIVVILHALGIAEARGSRIMSFIGVLGLIELNTVLPDFYVWIWQVALPQLRDLPTLPAPSQSLAKTGRAS